MEAGPLEPGDLSGPSLPVGDVQQPIKGLDSYGGQTAPLTPVQGGLDAG